MEDVDRKIINALIENSKLSYRQIAKKIGVSAATAMHHVKKLEKEKIIKGYTLSLDYDELGFDIQVIIDLRISKGKLYQVENKIAIHPNVYAVYDNTGPFDATIIAKFRSRKPMDKFLKEIQSYDFVDRTETKLILSTIKEKDIKV